MSIYDRVMERGTQLGLTTNTAIEEKCGIKPKTIEKWKVSIPKSDTLFQVSQALDVPMEYFFTNTFVDNAVNTDSTMERLLLKYFALLEDDAQLELVNECKRIAMSQQKRKEA